MSLLASTMSMFDSSIWKNGHSRYILCNNLIPLFGWASSQALTALPKPYSARQHQPALRPAEHPGDGAQILDPGRSSPRRWTAADVQIGDLADHCRFAEEAVEAVG